MKITEVKLSVLEIPLPRGCHRLVRVPHLHRIQYTHVGEMLPGPRQITFLHVLTDAGIEGIATGGTREMVDQLRELVIGEDPIQRESLFQKLHAAVRWLYGHAGWFGPFDNCLWDIAGKVTGQPVYNLLGGKVRNRIPIYVMGGDATLDEYKRQIDESYTKWGVRAFKVHSYKGGVADIPILRELRSYVGPDYELIHDPVRSYTLPEAIQIGHLLEELNYVWLEEPLHDENILQYQELCAALTIPVMQEWFLHDMESSAQRLLLKATDLLRASGNFGVTQVMKLAHFAELYGTNVELNGDGGLFGAVSTHLQAAIVNTTYYEGSIGWSPEVAEACGILNAPRYAEGHICPPEGPGFGLELDWGTFRRRTVAEY